MFGQQPIRRSIEKQTEHARKLEDLYASWQVFDLFSDTIDQLDPEWLVIFSIARKLLADKPVPGLELPESLMTLVNGKVFEDYEETVETEVTLRESVLPIDSMLVRTNKRLSEIARALPGQLLLMRVAPTLFWHKAVTGALVIAQPQEPQTGIEEFRRARDTLIPTLTRLPRNRQKVYILLDTSKSMEDHGKLRFAKALCLAYLLRAREEKAEVIFRHFRTSVYEKLECRRDDEFPTLARAILRLDADGSTNIAKAMLTAIDDIDFADHRLKLENPAARPVPAEILLISDCASYTGLPWIPTKMKLHTVHLEGGEEQITTPLAYDALVKEIRERSETFVRIDTARMVVTAEAADGETIRDEISEIEDDLLGDLPEIAKEGLAGRIAKVRKLARVYRKVAQSSNDPALSGQHAINGELAEGLERLLTWEGLKERMRQAFQRALRTRSAVVENLARLRPRRGRSRHTFRVRGG